MLINTYRKNKRQYFSFDVRIHFNDAKEYSLVRLNTFASYSNRNRNNTVPISKKKFTYHSSNETL